MKKRALPVIILFIVFVLSGCADKEWIEPFPDRLSIIVFDSIGIETGDSCYVLGSIVAASSAPNGNILMLDQSACIIRVFDIFDSTGTHVATAEFPMNGRHWSFSITPYGSLAWNLDPETGYQVVYSLELPEI